MAESNLLADSTYELISASTLDAEVESQDGALSESTGSLSAPRPDDVHSLDGSSNHYDSDSDDESDQSSHASSIRYADEALQNPSTHRPTSSLQYGSPSEGPGPVTRSIEFNEGDDSNDTVLLEKISVKHAIREFSEEESASIAGQLDLADPPKRLVATIRQTMSQASLSTKEPLRLLYVGRADAQRGIVLKICSAIWASPENSAKEQDYFSRHRDGVYNIVPISSFGPDPELDLMEASQYQIKVEHCTSAEEIVYKGASFPNDTVYSITIEHQKVYQSLFSPSGSVVQPRWVLPHVAVFYCSEEEDDSVRETRDAAWAFMDRHAVPCIFISEAQTFSKRLTDHSTREVGEHAVHLCLESRDPERPISPRRFPIDIASFLDIDARQMNRNLAYLTGLAESEETTEDAGTERATPLHPNKMSYRAFEEMWISVSDVLATVTRRMDRRTLFLIFPLFLVSFLALYQGFTGHLSTAGPLSTGKPDVSNIFASSQPACTGTSTKFATPSVATPATHEVAVATSTKTVVVNVTSTKTVQISETKPSTSSLASVLSYAGLLSDKPSAVPTEPEAPKKHCSVRIHSPKEVLVSIPSAHKATWFSKGAIDILVRRGDKIAKTRMLAVDEGILIELSPKDAYGILNVTVTTTRKPKINETFIIDFGTNPVVDAVQAGLHALQDAFRMAAHGVDEAASLVENNYLPAVSKIREEAARAIDASMSTASDTVARAKDTAESVKEEVDFKVLQAQVSARLWWLWVQGKTEEHEEYKRNATRLIQSKFSQLKRDHSQQGSTRSGQGSSKQSAQPSLGSSGSESRWKKLLLG